MSFLWENIVGDAIQPLMLQKLYRHSDLKTIINYQANFIHKEADDTLDAVINFCIFVLITFLNSL